MFEQLIEDTNILSAKSDFEPYLCITLGGNIFLKSTDAINSGMVTSINDKKKNMII